MDLLKIAMRLSPWIDATLIADALEVALEARKLDIAASPYDVSSIGLEPIKIESSKGREVYRIKQADLMKKAAPVRRKILEAYDIFLTRTFGEDILKDSQQFLPTIK